ncbi:MAG: hypothetical protein IKL89_07400 [Clostridia bacterium]|nr:hypothetical protein [Clostridia bacterium]
MNKNKEEQNLTVIGKAFSLASNITTKFSWFGITASSAAGFFYKNIFFFIPVVVFISILIVIHICKANNISIIKGIFNMFAYNMQYSFDEWTAQYVYHSQEKMSFYTTYKVKALQTGVDHIRVRFNWSGATESNPINPIPICEDDYKSDRLEFFQREYGYNHYKLYGKNPISKNDAPIKLGVKLENLEDKSKIASPHLLTSISVVTKKLNMRVILPSNIHPENIRCLEYLHSTDDFEWHDLSKDCVLEKIGNEYHITWVVDKPIFGGKYILSWDPRVS